nr:hypothetical protein Iba_chr12aCG9190 [Ipomoea batatas]GMD63432.1 hypothetical protein Iba_chr12bCG14790 [Ipomoea batatas]
MVLCLISTIFGPSPVLPISRNPVLDSPRECGTDSASRLLRFGLTPSAVGPPASSLPRFHANAFQPHRPHGLTVTDLAESPDAERSDSPRQSVSQVIYFIIVLNFVKCLIK